MQKGVQGLLRHCKGDGAAGEKAGLIFEVATVGLSFTGVKKEKKEFLAAPLISEWSMGSVVRERGRAVAWQGHRLNLGEG